MDYYPIFVDLKNKPVLIIGGGNIALEKIMNLLKSGPKITVIAPWIHPRILKFNKRIQCINRPFEPSDIIPHYLLVFGATGDSQLNQTISALCRQHRILCNTVDDPKYCHFIVPSLLRRGKLTVAISTAGVSPSLAKAVKDKLKQCLGCEYTVFSRWLVSFRQHVIATIPTLAGRMRFWKSFYQRDPLWHLRMGGVQRLITLSKDTLDEHT